MAGAIQIDFRVGGEDTVKRALTAVGRAAADAARLRTRETAAAAKAAVREEQRAAKEVEKAARDAGRAQVREAKAATAEIAREQRTQAQAALAAKRQETRELEKIERDYRARVRRENQQADREEMAAARARRGTRAAYAETAGRSLGRTAGTLAAVGGLAVGGLSLATVTNAGRQQMDLGRRNALLQNSSNRSDLDYVGRAKGLSNLTGESAGDVMGGFEKISGKAGGGALASVLGDPEALENLSKQAKAAGVTMTDLGDVIATLANRGVGVADMPKTFASLVQQGKDGAVEIKDLATELDASTGALLRFKMGAGAQTMSASGLTQIARTFGRSSAAEATSSVVDLARDIGSKGDVVQALTGGKVTGARLVGGKRQKIIGGGVEVGTDRTRAQLRDINELLPEIIEGAFKHGNAGKLLGEGGVFTGNSTAIATPLIQAYSQGITKDKAGRYQLTTEGQSADMKGGDAIRALLAQFAAGGADPAQGVKQFDNVTMTSAERINVAMNKLTNRLGDELAPKIEANLGRITAGLETAGRALAWVIENPIKSALLVAGGNLVKDIAAKRIGSLLTNLLAGAKPGVMNVQAGVVNMTGGGAAGGAGSSLLRGGAGVLAAGAAGVAVGVATAEAGNKDVDTADNKARGAGNEAVNLASKIRAGQATPADIARARTLQGELKSDSGGALNALKLYGQGFAAPFQGIAKGDYSAGNIAGAAMPGLLGPMRGLYDATLGTQAAGQRQGGNQESLKMLTDALDKPFKLAEGQAIRIANADEIGKAAGDAAARATTLDGPKVQHP